MPSASMSLDEKAFADLTSAMRKWVNSGRKNQRDTVAYAAGSFIQSAAKMAKKGETFRQVIPNPKWKGGRRRRGEKPMSKWLIVALKQNGPPKLFPAKIGARRLADRNGLMRISGAAGSGDPRAKIRNRGLARQSFGWMSRQLGDRPGRKVSTLKGYGGSRYRCTKVRRTDTKSISEVDLTNTLSYLKKAYPRMVTVATQLAANRLDGHFRDTMKKSNKRFNRRSP